MEESYIKEIQHASNAQFTNVQRIRGNKMPSGVYERTEEQKKNIGEALKGRIPVSAFKKGHTPWNKGLKGVMKPHSGCFKKGNIPWCTGLKTGPLSAETKKKMSIAKTGSGNSHWNGGRYVAQAGYVMIYKPDHPNCNCDGYVQEHRLVIEEMIGRLLTKAERVHHLDGNKESNKPDNLHLFPNNSAHTSYHNFLRNCVNAEIKICCGGEK